MLHMGNQAIHVSISAETVFRIFGLEISNSMFTSLVVTALLIIFALVFRSKFKTTDKPSSLQNVVEMIVEALYNFVNSITENAKKTALFFPIIATFFIFIILNNYVGLLPGVGSILTKEKAAEEMETVVANVGETETTTTETEAVAMVAADANPDTNTNTNTEATEITHEVDEVTEVVEEGHNKMVPIFRAATADLNTTLALALISVVLTQIFGVSHLGLSYFKKFIDFSNPLNFIVGILELVLEFAKIISFAFRLFGNIFAGEVLLVVMTYLIAIVVPTPFYALELFVGFIQALVFSMLSLIFFNLATKGHHEESQELAKN